MVRSGPYSTEEIEQIRESLDRVQAGEAVGDVANDLAGRFDRSSRGLALAIGRELARLRPRRPRRRHTQAAGRELGGYIQRLAALARELDDLGRRRKNLDKAIAGRVAEYSTLKATLLEAVTPANVDVTSLEAAEAEEA